MSAIDWQVQMTKLVCVKVSGQVRKWVVGMKEGRVQTSVGRCRQVQTGAGIPGGQVRFLPTKQQNYKMNEWKQVLVSINEHKQVKMGASKHGQAQTSAGEHKWAQMRANESQQAQIVLPQLKTADC